MLNVLSALASVAGAMAAFFAFDRLPALLPYFLALSAASFLYVAMADLIPGLHRGRTDASSLRQILLIARRRPHDAHRVNLAYPAHLSAVVRTVFRLLLNESSESRPIRAGKVLASSTGRF